MTSRVTRARRGRPVLAAIAALLLVATGCEFRQLPDGGFQVLPETPNGERVLIIGDSLIREVSLSVAFGTVGGGVETLVQATNASGLLSGPTDWDARSAELIAAFRPTIVLIQFVGNFQWPYWPPYNPPGEKDSPEWKAWVDANKGSPDFIDRYVAAGHGLSWLYALAGVRIYWLEPPPFPDSHGGLESIPDRLWRRWKVELPAALPSIRLLSVRSSVANPDSSFMRYKTICGTRYEIRTWDFDGGIHLTADGAGTYGRALARALASAEGWPAPPDQCPGLPD